MDSLSITRPKSYVGIWLGTEDSNLDLLIQRQKVTPKK